MAIDFNKVHELSRNVANSKRKFELANKEFIESLTELDKYLTENPAEVQKEFLIKRFGKNEYIYDFAFISKKDGIDLPESIFKNIQYTCDIKMAYIFYKDFADSLIHYCKDENLTRIPKK